MNMPDNVKQQLAKKLSEICCNTKPWIVNMKKEKESVKNSTLTLLKGRKMVINAFKSRVWCY